MLASAGRPVCTCRHSAMVVSPAAPFSCHHWRKDSAALLGARYATHAMLCRCHLAGGSMAFFSCVLYH